MHSWESIEDDDVFGLIIVEAGCDLAYFSTLVNLQLLGRDCDP
jgi:hypothetical protein